MLGDSLVHFCNTHLPSGDSVGKRASCVEDLYKEFCAGEGCDTFFLFGDLNFRVQIDLLVYKDIMEDFKINNPKIDFAGMMAKDEVKLNLHPCLDDHFEEAPLPRAPTYRFVKNTEEYSEERVASWYSLFTQVRPHLLLHQQSERHPLQESQVRLAQNEQLRPLVSSA